LTWIGDDAAESHGNRLLGRPRPDECAVARTIVRDFAERRSADLRRAAGAPDQKPEVLAYAWQSDGARAPPGADWRWCPGFGPYVRGLGLQRMGSGRWWEPSLYVSRVSPAAPDHGAWAWVTLYPPQSADPRYGAARWAGGTTWRVVFPPAGAKAPAAWIEVVRPPAEP
jgi:hypothetical protein